MAKGTLVDAANFLAAEADQLAVLNLLVALGDRNLSSLQGDAQRAWGKAQTGWRKQLELGGSGYDARKKKLTGQVASGVLSGGWRAYRCLESGEIVLSQPRKGYPRLAFEAPAYSAKELRVRRAYAGNGSIPAKPWRNWPQRTVPLDGISFDVPVAASIKALTGATIKDLQKALPLTSTRLSFKRLAREGRRIGRIRARRAKIQASLRQAVQNAL